MTSSGSCPKSIYICPESTWSYIRRCIWSRIHPRPVSSIYHVSFCKVITVLINHKWLHQDHVQGASTYDMNVVDWRYLRRCIWSRPDTSQAGIILYHVSFCKVICSYYPQMTSLGSCARTIYMWHECSWLKVPQEVHLEWIDPRPASSCNFKRPGSFLCSRRGDNSRPTFCMACGGHTTGPTTGPFMCI